MATEITGGLSADGLKLAIVVSRWNSFVTDRLLEGSLDAIKRSGGDDKDVLVVRVPGAWEMPIAVRRVAAATRKGAKRPDAIIALGCVIRGGTPHFEYVSAEAVKGCAAAGLEADLPVSLGILTCDTVEQAIDRAGLKAGNKGVEAAMAAIEMANLLKQL